MMSILRTLVLATIALMAAASGKHDVGAPAAGGLGVTRFVCAHCTATGQLSSRGLFLNRASVWRHIAASKHCRAADLGYRQIQVEARAYISIYMDILCIYTYILCYTFHVTGGKTGSSRRPLKCSLDQSSIPRNSTPICTRECKKLYRMVASSAST